MTISRGDIDTMALTPTSYRLPAAQRANLASELVGAASTEHVNRVTATLSGHYWITGERYFQPVRVALAVGPEGAMLIEPTTGVYGAGGSLAEAIEDVRAALVEHLEVLEGAGALSEDLREHQAFLRQHILV